MKKQTLILAAFTLGLWLVATPVLANQFRVINNAGAPLDIGCSTATGAGMEGVAIETTTTNQGTVDAGSTQDFTCGGLLVIQGAGSAFQCPSGQAQHVTVTGGGSGVHLAETCFDAGAGSVTDGPF